MGLLSDDHVYSYSQLSQVADCPYGFYLQRIEGLGQKGNAFASQGTLIHNIIDQWAKGTIKREEMVSEYVRRYPLEVREAWPRVLATKGFAQKTYDKGLEYFTNFDCFEGYKIIGTEEKFKTLIEDRPFIGIVDMILEDDKGNLIICDHKSKSLSSFKKNEHEMYRQQLLYSIYINEKYGKYPDVLMFNLFKENGLKETKPFDTYDFNEAVSWALEQIKKIEEFNVMDWYNATKKPNDFFCLNLCSVREHCPNGKLQRD